MRMHLLVAIRLLVTQRMQSPFLELFLAFYFPFLFASFVRSSYCKSVLVSISRILDFLLGMSLGHQLTSAIVVIHVTKCLLSSEDFKQIFQFFRLLNLHLVQTPQDAVGKSCQ